MHVHIQWKTKKAALTPVQLETFTTVSAKIFHCELASTGFYSRSTMLTD